MEPNMNNLKEFFEKYDTFNVENGIHLAESAGAAAVLSYGYPCYGFTGEITYVGTATEGKVTAEAKCKDCHNEQSVDIKVRIYDKDGNIIAKAKFVTVYT